MTRVGVLTATNFSISSFNYHVFIFLESEGGPPCPPPPPVFQTYARQLSGDSRDHEVTSATLTSRVHTGHKNIVSPDKTEPIKNVIRGKKSDGNIPVNLGDDDGGDGLLILGGGDKRYSEPLLTAPTRYVHKSELYA